jgi:hypothetical protein
LPGVDIAAEGVYRAARVGVAGVRACRAVDAAALVPKVELDFALAGRPVGSALGWLALPVPAFTEGAQGQVCGLPAATPAGWPEGVSQSPSGCTAVDRQARRSALQRCSAGNCRQPAPLAGPVGARWPQSGPRPGTHQSFTLVQEPDSWQHAAGSAPPWPPHCAHMSTCAPCARFCTGTGLSICQPSLITRNCAAAPGACRRSPAVCTCCCWGRPGWVAAPTTRGTLTGRQRRTGRGAPCCRGSR